MKLKGVWHNFKTNWFLFEQLVIRDYKQRYKRTALGMLWSVISPLLTLLIMKMVFTSVFGRTTPHYTIYIFAGTIVMSFYKEGTKFGMQSIIQNDKILTKINVPKYLFLLSKNVSALINFLLTLVVFFVFCAFDHINFGWHMLMLLFPIVCLIILNIGVGMILSSMFVFFRDTQYLYDIFLTLLNYVSAIFYTIDRFPAKYQNLFMLNPVYDMIKYFRMIVIDGVIPSLNFHILCFVYPCIFLVIGALLYKKYRYEFIYYL